MRIWLSARHPETGKRHIVLDMTRQEESEIFWVLRREVLQLKGGRAPKRNVRPNGEIRYRFQRKYLDRLLMAFPHADISPGIDRSIHKPSAIKMDVNKIDIPDFRLDLLDFQYPAIEAIMKYDRYMLQDGVGLRKTGTSTAALTALGAVPALVVVGPLSAKWVWEDIITRGTDWDCQVVDGTTAQRKAQIARRADITIVNAAALRAHPELTKFEYEMIITDEFHVFRNPKAQWTKVWLKLKGKRYLLLSGTPIMNRPTDSWAGLHLLWPERFPNFWAFEKWLTIKSTGYYQKVVGYKPDAMIALRDFIQDPKHSMRRRKDQVADNLPEVVYSTVLVDLTKEQRQLYKKIVDEMKLKLENGEIKGVNGILSMVTRAKQACFSPELYGGSPHSIKLEELKRTVEQLVDSGEKALIFSQWSKATRIIERELAHLNPAYVDGTVRGAKRAAQAKKFNEDDSCHIYIGTIRANKEAITLSAATYVLFTDEEWTPMDQEQAAGRSAAGGLRGMDVEEGTKVNVINFYARNTIESRVKQLLKEKSQMFNFLIERDGGPQLKNVTVSDIASLF